MRWPRRREAPTYTIFDWSDEVTELRATDVEIMADLPMPQLLLIGNETVLLRGVINGVFAISRQR